MLDIRDTLACVELACTNPAEAGRVPGVQPVHRVLLGRPSWPRWWSRPTRAAVEIEHLDDPRVEKEEHYYRAAHTKLLDLGLVPHLLNQSTISSLLSVADRHRDRVDPEAIRPTVEWRAHLEPPRHRRRSTPAERVLTTDPTAEPSRRPPRGHRRVGG